jgi:hypothetical protein
VDEFISSKHVIEFPLDAFGTKSSPAVMPFGQMMHGLSTSMSGVDGVAKVPRINPIASASTMATKTSPIKNHHLPTEIVLNDELNPESSALLGAEASIFSPTLARGGSSTPMTHTIISSNGVAVTSSTPMLGAAGAEGASFTPMMEVARKQCTSHKSADSLSFGRSFVCRTRGVDIFFAQDDPNFG